MNMGRNMKNILLTATALVLVASVTSADVAVNTDNTNGQNQQTSATNYNTFEGSEAINNTPGASVGSGNSTAPCVVASGFGLSGPGVGVSHANGRIDEQCVTRIEASILRDIASMPNGIQKTAVITHFCKNDESMRDTLSTIGLCAVVPQATTYAAQSRIAPYTFCGYDAGGVFSVKVTADSPANAAELCTADFVANGRVNIGTLN
jgi:hypothetical protein